MKMGLYSASYCLVGGGLIVVLGVLIGLWCFGSCFRSLMDACPCFLQFL